MCAWFRVRGRDWTNSSPDGNRAVLEAALTHDASENRAPRLVERAGFSVVARRQATPTTRPRPIVRLAL